MTAHCLVYTVQEDLSHLVTCSCGWTYATGSADQDNIIDVIIEVVQHGEIHRTFFEMFVADEKELLQLQLPACKNPRMSCPRHLELQLARAAPPQHSNNSGARVACAVRVSLVDVRPAW